MKQIYCVVTGSIIVSTSPGQHLRLELARIGSSHRNRSPSTLSRPSALISRRRAPFTHCRVECPHLQFAASSGTSNHRERPLGGFDLLAGGRRKPPIDARRSISLRARVQTIRSISCLGGHCSEWSNPLLAALEKKTRSRTLARFRAPSQESSLIRSTPRPVSSGQPLFIPTIDIRLE